MDSKRTLYPQLFPSSSPRSYATRSATDTALILRGWTEATPLGRPTASEMEPRPDFDPQTHLSDDDVALRGPALSDELVQDILGHLGGLATSCGASDDHDWVRVDGAHDLFFERFDGQLLPLG